MGRKRGRQTATEEELKKKKSDLILKLRLLTQKINRIPIEHDWVKNSIGQPATIKKYFGNWENFIKESKIKNIKLKSQIYEIDIDMERLVNIMYKYGLDPITPEVGYGNPVHKTLFCQILLEKYPDLAGNDVKIRYIDNNKTRVLKFIGVKTRQSIYHYTRENALESLKSYLDYYDKYLLIKAEFNDEYLAKKRLKLLETIEKANKQLEIVTNKILNG